MKEGSGGDEQGNKIEERVLEDNRKTRKVLMEMKKRMEEREKQERKRNHHSDQMDTEEGEGDKRRDNRPFGKKIWYS